jgi:hypothetical protein
MRILTPPSAMMRDIVLHSTEKKKEIIFGIDANAHHTLLRALTSIQGVRL